MACSSVAKDSSRGQFYSFVSWTGLISSTFLLFIHTLNVHRLVFIKLIIPYLAKLLVHGLLFIFYF